MAKEEIFTGEVGHTFRATITEDGVAVDVSGATVLQMLFVKPSRTVLTKTAVFNGDGTDGVIKYVSVAADLDQNGMWALQGYFELGAWKGYSDKEYFWVKEHF